MSQSKIVGAVEIGTSKVVVLIGEISDNRNLSIIGMGQSPSRGVQKGDIIDLKAASDAVHATINMAEKNAGTTIGAIFLAATGAHLDGFPYKGSTAVNAKDGCVTREDLQRATTNAKNKCLGQSRVYLHHIRTGIHLDGRLVEDPTTMNGDSLEVHYWHVHGDESKITNLLRIVNGAGFELSDLVLSSLSSGFMVASEEDKRNGVLVVDIGSGTTDYALYKNGVAQRTGVIAVGGDHLTNDLAVGLRINMKNAESLKVRFGKAVIDKNDKNDNVLMVGDLCIGDRSIPRLAIYKILQARVAEQFMILKNKLGSQCSPTQLPAGIILTGGGARLLHLSDASREILGVETRLGTSSGGVSWVTSPELRQPEYSTVLGLLHYALSHPKTDSRRVEDQTLIRKVSKLFKLT